MAQQPAVIIIARHGPRLDAADHDWHLSTPTPYDPPLTFGGWNQCRALGVRIASLLYAREQSFNGPPTATHEPPTPSGVIFRDFAGAPRTDVGDGEGAAHRKSKRRRHKVVIHTSPFLRCIETSIAIAAGIAQFVPSTPSTTTNGGAGKGTAAGRGRTPNQLHSMSPRLSGSDYGPTPGLLLPVPEPKYGFGQELARRVAQEQKKHRKSKLRVDAFLGEWMNPEYFEHITPPPPSALMLTTAKAELMHNEAIDVFTPTITTKSSHSSLWAGTSVGTRPHSRDSALDDWDEFHDALVPPSPRRDRTNSHSSVGSTDSAGSRRFHRNTYGPQSIFASSDTIAYAPPVPTYAVSTSSNIPKGYVSHARNNCASVDYQWDSSRDPQNWGDGGEYGEEWSLMHRRFRRGLTSLVYWYSQHNADDRGEDALGIDQADQHEDYDVDTQEDLVVVLVTHGAGCNALIGALTGQPVLMDVGMASLTMAVRKEDAPPASILVSDPPHAMQGYENAYRPRQGSMDIGLTAMYDMKIVASSEHLRPGYDPLKFTASGGQRTVDPISRLRPFRGDSMGASSTAPWSPMEEQTGRNSMSSALGSIRRPTSSYFPAGVTSAPSSKSNSLTPSDARDTLSTPDSGVTTPSSWAGGLWTPPEARTPQLAAQYMKDERRDTFSSLNEAAFHSNLVDAVQSNRFARSEEHLLPHASLPAARSTPHVQITADEGTIVVPPTVRTTDTDQVAQLEKLLDEQPPQALSRGMSQKALWKARPTGDAPKREFKEGPKRRWTLTDEQQKKLREEIAEENSSQRND